MSTTRSGTHARGERLVALLSLAAMVALFSVLLAHAPAEGVSQSVAESYLAHWGVAIPADPTLAEVQAAFARVEPGVTVIANLFDLTLPAYVTP